MEFSSVKTQTEIWYLDVATIFQCCHPGDCPCRTQRSTPLKARCGAQPRLPATTQACAMIPCN
eukprot:4047061-Lingulodinium_polyedra.AAC.1